MGAIPRRLLSFAFGILLFFGLVMYRLIDLQWIHGEKYRRVSQNNTLRRIPISAPRGKILDRHGRVLAENRSSFTLNLHRERVGNLDRAIRTAAYLLDWTESQVREALVSRRHDSFLAPIPLVKDLNRDQVARLRAKMTRVMTGAEADLDMDGLELSVQFERVYPMGPRAGHVLGYVREVSDLQVQEWTEKEPGRINPGDRIGVAGAEFAYDLELRGYDGFREIFVDVQGRPTDFEELGIRPLLQEQAAVGGKTLQLTLDARLMETAAKAFAGKVGSLVALDPRNGEILAWVSQPAYDPQILTGVVSGETWRELQNNPDKILLNRPIQAAYPPGSTYKIVTALAALAEGKVNFQESIPCPGYYSFGGRHWGCWNKKGHGRMNLYEALVNSCDVFFYRLGERLGPDRLAHYAKLLGLGQRTGALGDSEREGLIPTREWKERVRKQPWRDSDSLGIAIGQAYDLVTPLQNALMIARFANGKKKIAPHLLKAVLDEQGRPQEGYFSESIRPPASSEPLDWGLKEGDYLRLKQALVDVVNRGTGGKGKIPGIEVAGKTGTAQVIGEEARGRAAPGVKTGDHAWFVAFAPAENPEIAVAVIVEHGGHGGGVAAPIAQQVMNEYFFNREK